MGKIKELRMTTSDRRGHRGGDRGSGEDQGEAEGQRKEGAVIKILDYAGL